MHTDCTPPYMIKVKNDIVFFDQEKIHIRYIRKKTKRIGAMVAFILDVENDIERVVFGWSLCHKKDMKYFNSREAVERAMERAIVWDSDIHRPFVKVLGYKMLGFGRSTTMLIATKEPRVPLSIRKDFVKFIEKKMKYFKYINSVSTWVSIFISHELIINRKENEMKTKIVSTKELNPRSLLAEDYMDKEFKSELEKHTSGDIAEIMLESGAAQIIVDERKEKNEI